MAMVTISYLHDPPESWLTLSEKFYFTPLTASISQMHFQKWDRIKKKIPRTSDLRRQMLLSIFRNFKGAFKQQLSAIGTSMLLTAWHWISAVRNCGVVFVPKNSFLSVDRHKTVTISESWSWVRLEYRYLTIECQSALSLHYFSNSFLPELLCTCLAELVKVVEIRNYLWHYL